MKRLCKALALTLCAVMLLSTLTVLADTGGKTILTLEEAKKLALEDDTQYKLQQSYINQKSDDFEDVYDMYKNGPRGSFKNAGAKAEGEVSAELAIENAAFAYRKEIFKKYDLKRASDYEVTTAYYSVMKAKYSLEDANRAMELARKDLEIGKLQFTLGLITKTTLSQVENAYKSSQTTYNSAISDYENAMSTLGKSIGQTLDVSLYDIDMTISIPDITTLDLDKIKEDYMAKNESYYLLTEQLKLAKYKKTIAEEKYDDYTDEVTRSPNSDAMKAFDNLIYETARDYNDAQYQYDENIKNLDLTLKSQHTGIITTMESIENVKKSVENAKTTFSQNKAKYDLGLISRNEYEKSESSLKDSQNKLSTAIVNLNSQYLALTQYSYKTEK